ncbi:Cation-translocating P-type ATPase OS=Streptomyces tendae OX=1932 GN=GUR47_09910 PE=4 SV=1 [Streptomyces tendae]
MQTPGASRLFGCTPLGPVAWTGVAAAIALALAGQRALPGVEDAIVKYWPKVAQRLPVAKSGAAPRGAEG